MKTNTAQNGSLKTVRVPKSKPAANKVKPKNTVVPKPEQPLAQDASDISNFFQRTSIVGREIEAMRKKRDEKFDRGEIEAAADGLKEATDTLDLIMENQWIISTSPCDSLYKLRNSLFMLAPVIIKHSEKIHNLLGLDGDGEN